MCDEGGESERGEAGWWGGGGGQADRQAETSRMRLIKQETVKKRE